MVLAPSVLALAWWHPIALAAPMALAAAVIAFEIGTLYGSSGIRTSRGAAALVAAGLVVRWSVDPPNRNWIDLAIGLVVGYTLLRQLWHPRMFGRFASWGLTMVAGVYAGGLLGFIVLLRGLPDGFWWVVISFGVTWAFDIASYAVGKTMGRHGFMTHISPRKTWEGVITGVIATCIFLGVAFPLLGYAWWKGIALAVGVSAAAVYGDLVASMLKRDTGHKDSGNVIPGHGGMLDRLDSLLFVAPVIFTFAQLWG